MIYNLLLGISTAITQATYPLVVRLYSLFEYICTFKMLSEDFIESIWNNIYIFVAVIVLFAIAIKLISAMVNPDTLTDDKKGARGYYFRAVAAVILIFLVPIAFKASYDLQEELLTKNFLSTHVFGYKVAEGTNIGQILAWEGFSAFCLPDKASSTEIDNNYLSIRADMDNVVTIMNQLKFNGLANMVNPIMQITLIYGRRWEYHMFLCPLVGLLLVYEMVLLCMDTLFRSAKLAFLEVMTPIVLGAFVFDPSILKKWAKEFFSTYIALFLKVLAMYFIVISISQMQDEIENIKYYQGDWITTGLFKILLIISLLQLVKKIPELINKIFGIEIKSRGGIKGRLGEMAGIGGIASKAWSSLGQGVKNLGKAAVAAPFGVGYKVADKAVFNKTGKHLDDNKLIRGVKGAGQGFRTAWKTGSASQTIDAFTKGSAAPTYKPEERIKAQNIRSKNLLDRVNNATAFTYTDTDGTKKRLNLLDENGNWVNQYKTSDGATHYVPSDNVNKAKQELYSELEKQGDAGVLKAKQLRENDIQSQAQGIADKRDAAIQSLIKAAGSYRQMGNFNAANKAENIASDLKKGNSLSEETLGWFRTQENQDMKDALEFTTKIMNESNELRATVPDYDGSTGEVALKTYIGAHKQNAEGAKKQYEQAIINLSDSDKDYFASIDSIISSSNGMLNGAYQNNGSVGKVFVHSTIDESGRAITAEQNIKYDESDGKYYDVSGTTPTEVRVDKAVSDYVQSIKSGIVRTSAADYGIEVTEFDKYVSEITEPKGSPDYYITLHNKIRGAHRNDVTVINNIKRIEDSGFLPTERSYNNVEVIVENTVEQQAPQVEPAETQTVIQEVHEAGSGGTPVRDEVIKKTGILSKYQGEYTDINGALEELYKNKIHTAEEKNLIAAYEKRKEQIEELSKKGNKN